MSTFKPLALYQIETFGAGPRYDAGQRQHASARKDTTTHRDGAPARASEFLIQLMVGGDADLSRALGRREIAEQREVAYGSALANRPSARPLSFLRVLDNA